MKYLRKGLAIILFLIGASLIIGHAAAGGGAKPGEPNDLDGDNAKEVEATPARSPNQNTYLPSRAHIPHTHFHSSKSMVLDPDVAAEILDSLSRNRAGPILIRPTPSGGQSRP